MISAESEARYVEIAVRLLSEGGADGVILGYTEVRGCTQLHRSPALSCRSLPSAAAGVSAAAPQVGMLLDDWNVPAPVFDTAMIHCDAALELALSDD